MKKYIKIYIKSKLLLYISFFLFCCFVACLDEEHYIGPYNIIFIIIVGLLISTICIIEILHFKSMIKKQENLYNIKFSDENSKVIDWPNLYLCDDWIIDPGKYAIHKKHIKKIGDKKIQGRTRGGPNHKIIIFTMDDNKYTSICSSSTIKKIREWRKI